MLAVAAEVSPAEAEVSPAEAEVSPAEAEVSPAEAFRVGVVELRIHQIEDNQPHWFPGPTSL